MIDRSEVIAAYRLLLGREPENEAVVTLLNDVALRDAANLSNSLCILA